jgi:DNA repair protein RadC
MKEGDLLTSPDLVRNYLSAQLRHQPHEIFAVLFLDNQHRLIAYDEMFYGTIDGASVYPREVVKKALARNAAAAILAHNHPSGIAEPSQSDQRITKRLQEALNLVGVRVIDHMVVGDKEVISFAERGLL